MMQQVVRELRAENIKRIESYIHPENSKMKRARQQWSQALELQDVVVRKTFHGGEIVYCIDLEPRELEV